jgi:hypothetical protein
MKTTFCYYCLLPPRPDDGGSKHLWDVGKFLRNYTAQHPRRQMTGYEVLMVANMKMARCLWVAAPCSLVEVYRHFRGTCCPHNQGDDSSSVNFYQTTRRCNTEDSHLEMTGCWKNRIFKQSWSMFRCYTDIRNEDPMAVRLRGQDSNRDLPITKYKFLGYVNAVSTAEIILRQIKWDELAWWTTLALRKRRPWHNGCKTANLLRLIPILHVNGSSLGWGTGYVTEVFRMQTLRINKP